MAMNFGAALMGAHASAERQKLEKARYYVSSNYSYFSENDDQVDNVLSFDWQYLL